MRRLAHLVFAFTLLFTGCGGGDSAPWQGVTRLVVFGDSWSDGGAEKALTQQMVANGFPGAYVFPGPDTLYPYGNWSNGPTAVNQAATTMGVPIDNFALGGASSGRRLYDTYPGTPPLIDAYLAEGGGVLGQVDRYVAAVRGHQIDPNAVHVLWASGNDFFLWADFGLPGTPSGIAAQAVTNFEEAFGKLKATGVRRFLFVNSQYAANESNFYGQAIKDFKAAYNPALQDMVKRLQSAHPDLDIRLFDVHSVVKNIIDHPAQHGLTNATQACQPTLLPNPPPPCSNPDAYFYWDEFHPTRKGFSLVAAELVALYR
jgi:phospholipase/lecithinase/hemolysin